MNRIFGALVLAAVSGACVTSGTFDAKVGELNQALKREQDLKADVARLETELARVRKQLTGERDDLRKQLDDTQALVGELKQRLEKLGQNVEQLASERGTLQKGLEDAKSRLEELRKQKAAAEARAATFRTLVEKLRSMIDAGQIKVTIRNGRMLIALPNDVLFDSGKTAVKPEGKEALGRIAQVLATLSDRRYMVAGHTDNVPIKTARFPSNWDLSTARAVEVVNLLIAGGMRPETVGVAGYAEFDPVGKNDTPEGRALNRRIEIVLEPNLSDLPNLDSLLADVKK
ncbi:MAG TPA: OmpA family protein [Polyangia bacterium]|nr:OmpA family protein [Polyangia bacterium]